MMGFALGVFASIVGGIILVAATHPHEIKYLMRRRGLNRQLDGKWHEYHLTTDSATSPDPIWVHHEEELVAPAFVLVHGKSVARRAGRELADRLTGEVRGN